MLPLKPTLEMNYIFEYVCATHLSLDNNDANQIRVDLPGKGFDFQACCSLLIPVDPVEAKITKSGSKRGFDAMVSATSLSGRGSTGINLCWYPNKEFQALSTEQQAEL